MMQNSELPKPQRARNARSTAMAPTNGTSAKTLRNRRKRQRRNQRNKSLYADSMLELGVVDVLSGANTMRRRAGVPIGPSPADPRSSNLALRQLGQTTLGRNATIKILHPNGENSLNVVKFPDGSATTSVVMERRDEFELKIPPGDSHPLWDCILVDNPFLKSTQVAIRFWTDTVYSREDLLEVLSEALGQPDNLDAVYPKWFTDTLHPDFSFSVLESSVLTPDILGPVINPGKLFKSVRRVYMGSTVDLNAPDLANQGRVVAGQWNPDVTMATSFPSSQPDTQVDTYKFQVPAITETEIVASDEFHVAHEAKCGLYTPLRMFDAPSFTPSSQNRTIDPIGEGDGDPGPAAASFDLLLQGWCIGVSHWSGLSNVATLRIKRHEGIELIAAPQSVYSPFATPAYPCDDRAIAIIREFSRTSPHAYPADYNELGKLLQSILGGVGSAIGSLGLPVLSDIGNTVASVANSDVGNTLAGLLDRVM